MTYGRIHVPFWLQVRGPYGPLGGGKWCGGAYLGGNRRGGPQLDFTQEFEPVGDIREMTARLKELQDMRAEDVRDGGGNRSGSPTKVMDVDSNSEPEQVKLSPLEALKKLGDEESGGSVAR